MADQAPKTAIAPRVLSDAEYMELAGKWAMEQGLRPTGGRNFGVWDGGRRPWTDRTPGRADLKIVGKENSK